MSEKIIATADIDDNVIEAAREKEHIKSNDPERSNRIDTQGMRKLTVRKTGMRP